MSAQLLPRHPGLWSTTRLRRLVTFSWTPTALDWGLLVCFGVIAACSSAFLDEAKVLDSLFPGHFEQGLRIPGHASCGLCCRLPVGSRCFPAVVQAA